MDFSFTEEQQMIRDTAASFLDEVSDSAAVRRAMASEGGYDEELWARISEEMYWHAVHIPERLGGLGLGYVELVALLEEMGKHLLVAPFFSTVCLGVNALRVAGTPEQQEDYLGSIAGEGLRATLAISGPGGRYGASAISATFALDDEGATLNGSASYVPDGHTADLIVVAARQEGSGGEDGVGLFLVDADAAGVSRTWLPTMDQTRSQARIDLDNVRIASAAVMREPGNAWSLLDQILDLARIAVAAEQVGGAGKVLELTVEYIGERKQFGRVIGSFQALKHKAADMMLKAEAARSAAYFAACVADDFLAGRAMASDLAEAASIAKGYCSDAYFFNAGCAVQMHGGIGFTWEHDMHLFFKRAKSTQLFLGDTAFHRERLATQLLGAPA